MKAEQRKKQMIAVHAQFKRMTSDGVLAHTDCHVWASEVLGHLISTLTTCSDFELNALRDILNGKPPKIHARLRDVLEKQGKKSADNWCNWMMHNTPKYARYRNFATRYTVETIPLVEAYRMLLQVEPRNAEYRKNQWSTLKQPTRAVVNSAEQNQLWGR
jgi:hypothetical protein